MFVAFEQTGFGPRIGEVPGVALSNTLMLTGAPVPQVLVSVQVIVPAFAPQLMIIAFVFCPEVMVAPAGTVQL